MSDVVITPQDNGPYRIQGSFKIVTPAGREFPVDADQVWLCRCGHSGNKPFCDGTHKKIGFQSVPEPKP